MERNNGKPTEKVSKAQKYKDDRLINTLKTCEKVLGKSDKRSVGKIC